MLFLLAFSPGRQPRVFFFGFAGGRGEKQRPRPPLPPAIERVHPGTPGFIPSEGTGGGGATAQRYSAIDLSVAQRSGAAAGGGTPPEALPRGGAAPPAVRAERGPQSFRGCRGAAPASRVLAAPAAGTPGRPSSRPYARERVRTQVRVLSDAAVGRIKVERDRRR